MTTMEAGTMVTDKATAVATILARSVCLVLRCGELGNNRKIDLDRLAETIGGTTGDLDEQQVHATMRLIDPKTLLPAKRVQGRAKAYLRSVGIPAHRVFGEAATLIPLAKVADVDETLTAFEQELRDAAALVASEYDAARQAQAIALGPLYDATLYRSAKDVERAFTIEWSFVSFASPENLETVDRALALASQRKYEDKLATAFDDVVAVLRGEALEIMQDLAFRLAPGEPGKKRILRGSAFRDLQEYLANLPTRNLTGDDQLVAVMQRVAARLDGVAVEDLRDSASLRAHVHAVATEATTVLAGLVTTARARGIAFEGI